MNKLEQLKAAINQLPGEYRDISRRCLNLLDAGQLLELKVYVTGLRDMALHLTSDENLLEPLTKMQELLQ